MKKNFVTDFYRIRAAQFMPLLKDGRRQEWTFTAGGKKRARLIVDGEGGNISYALNGQAVYARINFAVTYPFFGGRRLWLVCPECQRRSGNLYLASKVACRRCLALLYPCQAETRGGKGLALLQRWRAKINEGGEKPRYMHLATYEAFKEKIRDRENASLLQFFGGIRGLKRLMKGG